jgi:hypothetical protein
MLQAPVPGPTAGREADGLEVCAANDKFTLDVTHGQLGVPPVGRCLAARQYKVHEGLPHQKLRGPK